MMIGFSGEIYCGTVVSLYEFVELFVLMGYALLLLVVDYQQLAT
ncbi:hypothetical protein LM7456_290012 [Listeria monocytogenes]|nr:hypothetical protein LM7456_290012 [Listeria monocytogenes]